MQVGTGKSILNGIAIGKLKIYKKKDTVISTAQVADTAAEEARFEEARAKAIDQQTALYEKALAEAGEDIAEVFNIHAMMLDDDDFVDAIKEIINGQHMCAEYAVKKAGDNQAAVFAAMDDPYLQARSADVIDIAQAMLDILQGVDNATLQGTEPSILVAEDLAPSETVRMDKSLLLGFITREGSSNSHTAILARSMNIPALIQCKEIQEDWDGKMAVVDGYNACVYVDPTPDLLESESSLSDVQYQIESWQSQLDWYSNQVSCCTVYITLNEVETLTPTSTSFGAKLLAALRNGWTGFVSGAQAAAVFLVGAWPAILIGAVCGVIYYRVRHPRKKK